MLDDVSLPDKVRVAREWFRRASLGEMPFTTRSAQKFTDLLEQIQAETEPRLSLSTVERLRIAIVRWDALAKAERAGSDDRPGPDLPPAFAAAKDAFEDAFNILIHQFEKEYPHGQG